MSGRASVIASLLLWSCCLPGQAHADACGHAPQEGEPPPEARSANERALESSREGRYDEALALFQRAYDLSPSFVILYNIGKMAALTGDHARALSAFECHLRLGDAAVGAERRQEVDREIATLKTKVATLAIEVDEIGAAIDVDGVPIGVSPLAELVVVNPGRRLLRARGAAGSVEEQVEVQPGARSIVRLRIERGAPPLLPPPVDAAFQFPKPLVGAAWIVTGLSGVAAAVTGTVALATTVDIEDDVYLGHAGTPPTGSDLDLKIARVRTLAQATDVLIVVAAISGAGALTFSIVNLTAEPEADEEQPAGVHAWAVVGPAFVGVSGEF